MMYMPDLLEGTLNFIRAPSEKLTQRVYNMGAMDFTPAKLAETIASHVPGFEIKYAPDFRQAIADSWPKALDDSRARKDWGWAPRFDTAGMTKDMLEKLGPRIPREGTAAAKSKPKTSA